MAGVFSTVKDLKTALNNLALKALVSLFGISGF